MDEKILIKSQENYIGEVMPKFLLKAFGVLYIFSFLLIFFILANIGKTATGQTCSQMPKQSKEIKLMTTSFLGRKDKGKKFLQDTDCTVGREEIVEMKKSKLRENRIREKK